MKSKEVLSFAYFVIHTTYSISPFKSALQLNILTYSTESFLQAKGYQKTNLMSFNSQKHNNCLNYTFYTSHIKVPNLNDSLKITQNRKI